MTAIINRVPTSRIISLHAEIQYLNARFGSDTFELKGLKYDSEVEVNPLQFFALAINDPNIGLYDPYLKNPLSLAKFHLTQSIQSDSQKSKSASECANALEALGWIERETNTFTLTEKGKEVANLSHLEPLFLSHIRESVLGYGPFFGFLFKCNKLIQDDNQSVKLSKISIGYRNTHEYLRVNNRNIPISTGSTPDTITRTRSSMLGWAISSGFALPIGQNEPEPKENWFIETLPIVTREKRRINVFNIYLPDDLFSRKHYVERPLSYKWLTKNTRALRERNQALIREYSIREEPKLKNRRFALAYLLAKASEIGSGLNFHKLMEYLQSDPQNYVINPDLFGNAMNLEKDFCVSIGIPFIEQNGILYPVSTINCRVLSEGAPRDLIRILDQQLSNLVEA